jgi:hypothetical protein
MIGTQTRTPSRTQRNHLGIDAETQCKNIARDDHENCEQLSIM